MTRRVIDLALRIEVDTEITPGRLLAMIQAQLQSSSKIIRTVPGVKGITAEARIVSKNETEVSADFNL